MKVWKIALWLCVIPMLSMVGTSWVFSLDFWANASGNATVPNQDFVQTAVINQVNLGSYYCINDSVAIETADLNSISAEPLVY